MQEPVWRWLTVDLRLETAQRRSDFLFSRVVKVPEIWGSIYGKQWLLEDLAGWELYMQVQKCDLTFRRVVLLELPGLQQAALVSCFEVNPVAHRALPYCLGFPWMCDRCVGQRSSYVGQVKLKSIFQPCQNTGQSSHGNRDHHQTAMGILLFFAAALGSEKKNF